MREVDLGQTAFGWIIALGMCYGILSVFVMRRWSDRERLRIAGNAMAAHLMEFRLFPEEPVLILRAQRDLLVANARLLRVLLVPTVVLTLPFLLFFAIGDTLFGRASLRVGSPAVVTAHYEGHLPNTDLTLPIGFVLETPAVQILKEKQISWRIRPVRQTSGDLQLRSNSQVFHKTISSQNGLLWISDLQSLSPLSFFTPPKEFDWVHVQYPAATVFGHHWVLWFSLAACGGAALFTIKG